MRLACHNRDNLFSHLFSIPFDLIFQYLKCDRAGDRERLCPNPTTWSGRLVHSDHNLCNPRRPPYSYSFSLIPSSLYWPSKISLWRVVGYRSGFRNTCFRRLSKNFLRPGARVGFWRTRSIFSRDVLCESDIRNPPLPIREPPYVPQDLSRIR
jgi:hypothetical protein